MSSFYEEVMQHNPVLFMMPKLGHFVPLVSINGTITTEGSWGKNQLGYAARVGSTGRCYTIPDGGLNPQLQLTTGTILTFQEIIRPSIVNYQYLWSKWAPTGIHLYSYILSSSVLYLGSSLGSRTVSVPAEGAQSIGYTFESGQVPKAYVDGVFAGNFSGVVTIVANNAPLYINALYTGGNPSTDGNQAHIWIPSILNPEQIANIQVAWNKDSHLGSETGGSKKFFSISKDIVGLSDEYLMIPDSNNKVSSTRSSRQGTLTGQIVSIDSFLNSRAVEAYGNGHVTLPTGVVDSYEGSVEGVYTIKGLGPNGMFFSTKDSYIFIRTGSGTMQLLYYRGSVPNAITGPTVVKNEPFHVVATWGEIAGTPTMELFVNGVSYGSTGYTHSFFGETLCHLGWNAANQNLEGTNSLFRLWSKRLTQDDVTARYNEISGVNQELSPRFEYPVSLAAVTSGECGPYQVELGSFQWTDDGSRRILYGVSSSDRCHAFSSQKFGGWYFKGIKAEEPGSYIVHLLGNQNSIFSDSGFYGYLLIIAPTTLNATLYKVMAGATSSIFVVPTSFTAGVEFEIFMTRCSCSGTWKLWSKSAGTWNLLTSQVESSLLTQDANFFSADIDDGDTLSDVRFFPYAGNANPTLLGL